MASRRQTETQRPAPRLYLVTPAMENADVSALKAALQAAQPAATLLRLAQADERALIKRIKAIAPTVQATDTALILDGCPELVARAGADGAHLTGIDEFLGAIPQLKPDWIAGAGGILSRHDAMLAAERDADYVMFGEPDEAGYRPPFDQIVDRITWWAEVFQIPCVAFAQEMSEIAPLVRAGADFVAVGDFIFADPRGPQIAAANALGELTAAEPVG